jgi:hypothetical protein
MSKINTVEDILLGLPRNLVTLITSFLYIKKKKPIKTLEDILSNLPSSLINYILTFLYEKKDIGEINFRRKILKIGEIGRRPFVGENEIKILCQNEKIIKNCRFPVFHLGIVENNGKYNFYFLKKIQILENRIENRNILKLKVWLFHQYRVVMGYEIIDAGNNFFEALDKILGCCCENCGHSHIKKKNKRITCESLYNITCKSLYDNIFFQNY